MRTLPPLAAVVVAVGASLASADVAFAQDPPPRPLTRSWQVEYEFGLAAGLALAGGTSDGLPAPGASFTSLVGGLPSRRVPSWFFGDGAQLLNDALANGGLSARVIPLDSALTGIALQSRVSPIAGFRAVRGATPRVSIEVGVDIGRPSFQLSDETVGRVEATRASFVAAFTGLLGDPTRFSNAQVTATAGLRMSGGIRANLTGAVRIHLGRVRGLEPYIVAGGGGAFAFRDGPVITLTGNYAFMAASGFGARVWDERDQFIVRYRTATARPLVIAGGGISRTLDRRRGFVVDARVAIAPDAFTTVLEARPARVTGPNAIIFSLTTPTIQFSSVGGVASSLANNLSEFFSHKGTTATNVVVAARYYVRY